MKLGKAPVIVPARAGSKGIPGKNIIEVYGKPLILWTIEHALNSECVSDVFVSTDGEEIAEISSKAGAKVINRPADISDDFASSEDAIIHAIQNMENEGEFENIIFLQATSPLRRKYDIDRAYEIFVGGDYDSLFSSCVMDDYTLWQGKPGQSMRSITFDYKNRGRRQDREPIYLENGSIYIFKKSLIERTQNRIGGSIGIYKMPLRYSFELDTLEEKEILEYYLKEIMEAEKR